MIYILGICRDEMENLEDMQVNKLKSVCEKCQLKEGEWYLDIGCGWGILVNYVVENYGIYLIGVIIVNC